MKGDLQMAEVFSRVENVYNITAVSDFCSNCIQRLPFSAQYARQAANQLVAFYDKLNLAELTESCKILCADIIANLKQAVSAEISRFDNLVICYEAIRVVIVTFVILFEIYNSNSFIEYKTCLTHLEEGRIALGIDLGEAAIAHFVNRG